jgi:ComF family protein
MQAGTLAREAAVGLLDLVFAPVCVACRLRMPGGVRHRLVCGLCWARSRPVPAPRCERCWSPVRQAAVRCAVCIGFPPHLRAARSALLMEGPFRRIVSALKYRGWESVAGALAERMASVPVPRDVVDEAALVVPVPTTAARVRARGYNQAERLAAAFAARTGRRVAPQLLRRGAAARTQTALQQGDRRANVARAFGVPDRLRSEVEGEHLILVDDVWTTGSTALAAAGALVEGGARLVSVVTAARAPLPGGTAEGEAPP